MPIVVLFAGVSTGAAYDHDTYYRYGGDPDHYVYHGYYGDMRRMDNDIELSRIRRELRDQRRLDNVQDRRQQQELELLRQQAFSNTQVSAQQACYYRTTGGFEVCADLFAKDSSEFDACEALVIQRNPACNDMPLRHGDGREASE
jgi:hypothetical protein